MLLNTSLLFELAIYRIDEEKYYDDFKAYVEKNKMDHISTDSSYYLNSFGGQWEYNEITGFLKFYISGSTQIRVEYHETKSSRKVKTRKKTFEKKQGSFCTRQISKDMTNDEIIIVLKECIEHCRENLNSNRYINTAFFDSSYRQTDWKSIIA